MYNVNKKNFKCLFRSAFGYRYKSQFAAWWQNTERHFHTMRMANYVVSVQERY